MRVKLKVTIKRGNGCAGKPHSHVSDQDIATPGRSSPDEEAGASCLLILSLPSHLSSLLSPSPPLYLLLFVFFSSHSFFLPPLSSMSGRHWVSCPLNLSMSSPSPLLSCLSHQVLLETLLYLPSYAPPNLFLLLYIYEYGQ